MPQLTFTHRQADSFPLMWVLPAGHADMVHFKELWMSELNASRLQYWIQSFRNKDSLTESLVFVCLLPIT